MRLFVFFILSLISVSAHAEYRMFLLQVTNPDGTAGRQIPSTLDPDQYLGYYHLKEGETLTYVDTWMCKGRTNEMPACRSPNDPTRLPGSASTSSSASSTTPAVLETPAPAPAAPTEPGTASPP